MQTINDIVKSVADHRQVGGNHYSNKSIQPWDAMQAWMTHEAFEGYLQGCAIKYLSRWKDKGGIEDLRKATHYIEKLIEINTVFKSNAHD